MSANLAEVRERMDAACRRAGRDPAGVRLVAVSKGVPAERAVEAVEAGVRDLGESRAQELRDKRSLVPEGVRWHFLGAVQTNKVRYLDGVHLVHGVDRIEEGEALDSRARGAGRPVDVLVEVNVAGERTKQGVAPERAERLLRDLSRLTTVRVRGLMMMAPRTENPEDGRWVFAETRRLRDRLRGAVRGLTELSMGMSEDFEVAIEEGATIVRIGRAIFREE